MAMSMSSVFTGAERRKKVVTYGRAPRLSNAQLFAEDVPSSPERPRKHPGGLSRTSQEPGAASGSRDIFHALSGSPEPGDVFDVPSDPDPDRDHDPTPRAAPIRKALPKPKSIPKPTSEFDTWDVPSSGDEQPMASSIKGQTAQPTRKTNASRPKLHTHKAKTQDNQQTAITPPTRPFASAVSTSWSRSKTPVPAHASLEAQAKVAKKSVVDTKVLPRPASSLPQVIVQQKRAKPTPLSLAKEAVPMRSSEPDAKFAVFDVPPHEDSPAVLPARSRKPLGARSKAPSKPSTSRLPPSPEHSAESDTSNASHKRKRRGSTSSSLALKPDTARMKREASVPHRSKKHQKTEDGISPGHTVSASRQPTVVAVAQDPFVSKLKRTRTRTIPVVSRPSIQKAQSTPGKLHSMLTMRSAAMPSPTQEITEATIPEDETMYDIPEETTPLARGVKPETPGSVTPRQRDLFKDLLDDDSDSITPMPTISKLQLTSATPGPLLTRSSSDITHSAHNRSGKLIDMLKGAVPSLEEESDSDEESEEESEEDATRRITKPAPLKAKTAQTVSQETADAISFDQDTQTSSQMSLPAVLRRDTSRTYANTRSYLEESNLEDGLLNWNEDIEVDMGDRQGSVTGSEDDSQQVTGLPELRRKGQLYKFQVETLAMIEDISGNDSNSISAQRSAMMEFASQMANDSFVNQLLESAMTSSLLRVAFATEDTIFDFAAAAAMVFMLRTKPSYAVVEQIHQSDIMSTVTRLFSSPLTSFDIHRIAKDRRTNMAASARETVAEFRMLILKTLDWPAEDVPKLSPQLLATKVLEMLVLGLRASGNTDPIVGESIVDKILNVVSGPSQRLRLGKATAEDDLVLEIGLSTLESLSISKEDQVSWSDGTLRKLVIMISALFETTSPSPLRLAIRLCMNVSNGRPKACQIFADENFVNHLTRFIVACFQLSGSDSGQHPRVGMRDDLILGLGAMMNLAEFSDSARLSIVQGDNGLIDELVKIFLEGSERAEQVCRFPSPTTNHKSNVQQADSMEESQYLVPIGYLTMLLGNLCLNERVRRSVACLLPGNDINLLVQKVKEFVQYNQRLDQAEFEGAEGQQTLQNFTLRLMLVVERLERAVQ